MNTDAEKGESTWRKRFSKVLIEVSSIIFAVMVALIADEWRDDRQQQQRAEAALEQVMAEVAENLSELEQSLEENAELAAYLATMANGEDEGPLQVNMALSLVSDAAWESAKMTQAMHHIEFNRVTELAQYYDQLAFFARRQDAMLTLIGQIRQQDSKTAAADSLAGQLQMLLSMQGILIGSSTALLENDQIPETDA